MNILDIYELFKEVELQGWFAYFFIEHHYFNLTGEASSWFRNLYKSAANNPENSIIMAMNLCRTGVFIRQNYHLMLKAYYQES